MSRFVSRDGFDSHTPPCRIDVIRFTCSRDRQLHCDMHWN
jgi:hypothetical protein